jgi:hypothetical protein
MIDSDEDSFSLNSAATRDVIIILEGRVVGRAPKNVTKSSDALVRPSSASSFPVHSHFC